MRPTRIPLHAFPDIVLHADELAVKRHPHYAAAKAGDAQVPKPSWAALQTEVA